MNKEQAFLVLMLALAALMVTFVVMPFVEYIVIAAILAYTLTPLHRRLRERIGSRAGAIGAILLAIGVLFLPLVYVVVVLTQDVVTLSRQGLPPELARLERRLSDLLGREIDIVATINSSGQQLFDLLFQDVGRLLSASSTILIGASITLFLIYYLLLDGDAFVDWMIARAPAPELVCQRVIQRIDETVSGVIYSHFLIAVLQGLVGGVGLAVAGVPNPAFWTLAMIILGLLPVIGAFLIWGPASGYLLLVDQVYPGVFLAIWGIVVVGSIDNFVRPIVIDRQGAHINPGIILVGVFGGVTTIGFTGLFVGPILLAVLASMIEAFDEEYDGLGRRPGYDEVGDVERSSASDGDC